MPVLDPPITGHFMPQLKPTRSVVVPLLFLCGLSEFPGPFGNKAPNDKVGAEPLPLLVPPEGALEVTSFVSSPSPWWASLSEGVCEKGRGCFVGSAEDGGALRDDAGWCGRAWVGGTKGLDPGGCDCGCETGGLVERRRFLWPGGGGNIDPSSCPCEA